ncbi:type IV secretion system protein [Falsirhodobacter sp. 1013]|uniref:type IV secretion system protein n=1 Tax=Falsirhodobacter sp. 1013 TaxID=3417566 RepID=UPI003EB88CA5
MATYIQTTLDSIDNAILGYTESVFADFGGAIATTCQLMGLVALAFMAANSVMQLVPVRYSDYLKWGVRFVVVTMIATSWQQFHPIYNIVTDVPGNLGASFLQATSATNMNEALDEMITSLFEFSDRAADESGMFSISLTSVLIWVLGALLAVVAIIIMSLAKVGLAMAIALAPIFVPCLLFKATSNLFESWVKFTLGFAMIPLVTAGVMGAIVGIGTNLIREADGATELSEAAGFLIVSAAGIWLMAQVPTLVNSLAGTITATATGLKSMQDTAGSAAKMAASVAAPYAAGAMAMAQAAAAPAAGQSRIAAAMEERQSMKDAGKRNVELTGIRNAERGHKSSFGERREADWAARMEQHRENKRFRQQQRGVDSAAHVDRTSQMLNRKTKKPGS